MEQNGYPTKQGVHHHQAAMDRAYEHTKRSGQSEQGLLPPGQERWQTRLLRCVDSIRQLHRKNLDAELLTWRQLLIQHGEREALQLLRIGEVKKVQVASSQIPRYVRISGKEILYLDTGSIIETGRPNTQKA